jgi:Tol biopolymer transport system component
LPYDTKSTQIGGTGFPMEDMNKALRQVTAAHKILITDACHSGGVTTEGARGGLEINDINAAFHDRLTSSKGVHATFTASGPNQTSMESEQWGGGHGVFTHFLLQGLEGAADENADHIVDLDEMMKYTTTNVERATARRQVPMIGHTAYNGAFPVAMVIPGEEIKKISIDEIAKYHKVTTVMTSALESAWIPPDSLTLVAGIPDTLRVRLQNENNDVLPPNLLHWSSTSPAIATVDTNGVVTPVSRGTVQINASREGRKVTTLVRVLPRPSDVVFSPAESNLELVLTESFRVRSDFLIGTDQWIPNMAPRLVLSDTLILRQQPGMEFVAYREGTATLTASIGGKSKQWNVRVIPPSVKVKPIPVAVSLSDSIPLRAWRVRPDGAVLGDAANVVWRSTDTARVLVRNGQLHTRGIGKATIVGALGGAVDSISTFVLGDLLVGTDGDGGPSIVTIGLVTGEVTRLLPKGVPGTQPALSPKGDRIAFVANKRLFIMETDGTNVHRLTPDMKGLLGVRMSSYEEYSPSWTNDGSHVVFLSNAHGNYEVLSVSADGKDVQRLTNTDQPERNVSAAIDVPQIAFERVMASDEADIVLALPDGSQQQTLNRVTLFGIGGFSLRKPKFLPGAQEIVYVKRWADRGGESLHVMDAHGLNTKDLLSPEKDNALLYAVSPDGQRIAYHRVAEWGRKNNNIVVIDRNGGILQTIPVSSRVDIKSIAWGASSSHSAQPK